MRTLEISEETYEKIKGQLTERDVNFESYDDLVGKKLFIRTVTYHFVGEVVNRFGFFIQLKDASWVASSGRFMHAIKEGELDEVEPVGNVWVNLNTITDFYVWNHKLPKEQK